MFDLARVLPQVMGIRLLCWMNYRRRWWPAAKMNGRLEGRRPESCLQYNGRTRTTSFLQAIPCDPFRVAPSESKSMFAQISLRNRPTCASSRLPRAKNRAPKIYPTRFHPYNNNNNAERQEGQIYALGLLFPSSRIAIVPPSLSKK